MRRGLGDADVVGLGTMNWTGGDRIAVKKRNSWENYDVVDPDLVLPDESLFRSENKWSLRSSGTFSAPQLYEMACFWGIRVN